MDKESTGVAATVAAIEAAFDGRWGVWLSDTGQWWAARRRSLSADELSAGCVSFIQADSPGELRDRIRDEEQLTP